MADSTANILERVAEFLEHEREVYGDFAVDIDTEDNQTEVKLSENATIEKDSVVQESEADYSGESQSDSVAEQDITSRLQACETLEELRQICEQADQLKTDLENTNLVFGVGNSDADLMIVGEAPGFNEDKQGEPFVGKAGKLLNKILDAINFGREDVYIANILKHRPPNNRNPLPEERSRSLPFLIRQIELVDPKIILCLGKVSANTMLSNATALGKLRGKFHSFMHNIELMATYHPAALLRNPKWKRPTWEDVQLLRKRYDELEGSP